MIRYDFVDDPDGCVALERGARKYDEAMGYSDPADKAKRIDCFRQAEALYLKAAEKGNPIAYLNLGYVYSYDRCEGVYYGDVQHAESGADWPAPFPCEERAFACFQMAAEAEIAEGCYKLGDMYKHGTGCDPDAVRAFECYMSAAKLSELDEPVIWGSVALRLGDAYENGFGCEQSFERAHHWYKKAETCLEIAVNAGDWYYRRALSNARNGVKRTAQELQLNDIM